MSFEPYRLIWFQHFHKAAGSSIVEAAWANGERGWPHNLNGNPLSATGEQIDLASFSRPQLKDFVDQCEANQITFVVTEWRLPDIDFLAADSRVVLVTCLRDPLERFVSNFYYDLYRGYTSARTLQEYRGSRQRTFTMDNYYCRILSGQDNSLDELEESAASLALRVLGQFDFAVRVEDGIEQLSAAIGWSIPPRHANSGDAKIIEVFKHVLKLRWLSVYLLIRYRRTRPEAEFVASFKADNSWDYWLLNQTKPFASLQEDEVC